MSLQQLMRNINQYYCLDEQDCIKALRTSLKRSENELQIINAHAAHISQLALNQVDQGDTLQALLQEYQLSSDEGLALMALTEALLRIPDQAVASQLIADRTRPLNWGVHLHKESPFMINASTLMLMLTGKILTTSPEKNLESYAHKLLRRTSQPFIHAAMKKVIEAISAQFVFAENVEQALVQISRFSDKPDCFSLDMLGESALSRSDAEHFFYKYNHAMETIINGQLQHKVSLSIKLSALHPRYEYRHAPRCINELSNTLSPLTQLANKHHIDLTIDAEEAVRQDLGLKVFSQLYTQSYCGKGAHLGIAVQAYSPRSLSLLKYLKQLAECSGRKIPVRLVKGAYWDSEIKQAQIDGLSHYPVFTHKHHTEISYLACADYLLANRHYFYPQFATHNAVTICDILQRAEPDDSYEFQRLHGMGEPIYRALRNEYPELKIRIYGPVGQHKELLPYLVRRVLENGANNSFLKQLLNPQAQTNGLLENLCQHPLNIATQSTGLPLPKDLYLPSRDNSQGLNLANDLEREKLLSDLDMLKSHKWESDELVCEKHHHTEFIDILSPYDGHFVGSCHAIDSQAALEKLGKAQGYFSHWRFSSAQTRSKILVRFAQLLQEHQIELVSLLVREAGKTIPDSLNEIRETIDFAYYYSRTGLTLFETKHDLPSITGEQNTLELRGRGVFLCISPWNFPLAIFSGQILAALMAGNTVLAKPAELTPLIARLTISLLYQAGLPEQALLFIPGTGKEICPDLCLNHQLAGIAFTGSNQTAQHIAQTLVQRNHNLIPFISETGGQNAMIVDSSALPEQVVKDVLQSAFYSAGQRCSALRVLYLQKETAQTIIILLKGAMKELSIGNPSKLDSDIGPIISTQAKLKLEHHIHYMTLSHKLLYACELNPETNTSQIIAPHVFEIKHINDLEAENFGPILHIITYEHQNIEQVVNDINHYGYGLTCGIHSRNEVWAKSIAKQLNIGNIYINRNIIGAIVGSQPFGGQGLSGTGPKAGGPNYLQRFATETCVSNNVAAIGGNVELISKQ